MSVHGPVTSLLYIQQCECLLCMLGQVSSCNDELAVQEDMETPGGEGSAQLKMQQGNTLKSLSRTFKPAGLSKPGKSDTQKPTAPLKATKPDLAKPTGVSKQGKPPEKVPKLFTRFMCRLVCHNISFCMLNPEPFGVVKTGKTTLILNDDILCKDIIRNMPSFCKCR